jgi:hypothetical protein
MNRSEFVRGGREECVGNGDGGAFISVSRQWLGEGTTRRSVEGDSGQHATHHTPRTTAANCTHCTSHHPDGSSGPWIAVHCTGLGFLGPWSSTGGRNVGNSSRSLGVASGAVGQAAQRPPPRAQRSRPAYHSGLDHPAHAWPALARQCQSNPSKTERGPSGCAAPSRAWRLPIQFCRHQIPSHDGTSFTPRTPLVAACGSPPTTPSDARAAPSLWSQHHSLQPVSGSDSTRACFPDRTGRGFVSFLSPLRSTRPNKKEGPSTARFSYTAPLASPKTKQR